MVMICFKEKNSRKRMHSFLAEFHSKLSGTFKNFRVFCKPEVAFLTHAYNTYPICCARKPTSSGIVDRGVVLLWVFRTSVSLFIYEITTPWTKSIHEKEKIYLRFFYGLREKIK